MSGLDLTGPSSDNPARLILTPDCDTTYPEVSMSRVPCSVSLRLYPLLSFALAFAACSDDSGGPKPPTPGDEFSPTTDVQLEGSHVYDAVEIPAGVTVTASSDLTLRSRGAVRIRGRIVAQAHQITVRSTSSMQISGELRNASSGPPGDDPPGITLISNGDLELDSARVSTDGDLLLQTDSTLTDADFPDSTLAPRSEAGGGGDLPIVVLRNFVYPPDPHDARAGQDGQFAGDGHDGSDLTVTCRGHLMLAGGSVIASQRGGNGGNGSHESSTHAVATGGNGGKGGRLRLRALGQIVVIGTNTLESGGGGDGGRADATGRPSESGGTAAGATATGGRGGDPGLVSVYSAQEIVTDEGTLRLAIGKAGDGGDAVAHGASGHNAASTAAQAGGAADATGGAGGSTPDKRLRGSGVSNGNGVEVTGGDAGAGGNAHAFAGDGGNGNEEFPPGAKGGGVTARGGDGGDAELRDQFRELVGDGGNGGLARIVGGNGGSGFFDCGGVTLPGGDGGDGGDGTAIAGDGGRGATPGEDGEVEIEVCGNGGDGGDGFPAGHGGHHGTRNVVSTAPPVETAPNFEDGEDGIDCPPTGACCASDGSCSVLTEADCARANGSWRGAGGDCDPNPCLGACCFSDGSCQLTSEPDCHGGSWSGSGSVCDPNPCAQPTGACCFPTAPCAVITEALCASNHGTYIGAGTDCDPSPCGAARGACCIDDGSICQVRTAEGCTNADGLYKGDGTSCDPNPCAPFVVGACCFETGACQVERDYQCAEQGGSFRGDHSSCEPSPCGAATGACCAPDGACTVTVETGCDGAWMGEASDCDPNPCVSEVGACCFIDHTCGIGTLSECALVGGEFLGVGSTCEGDPCSPGGVGACCIGFGLCAVKTQATCDGDWQGEGTDCAPVPCPSGPVGGYFVTITVTLDPHGHDPFVMWSNVHSVDFGLQGSSLTATGAFPWVTSSGPLNPDGTFELTGKGTVAGRSNVDVHFKGDFREQGGAFSVSGLIKLGNDTPPFQLPNGSITYGLDGVHR